MYVYVSVYTKKQHERRRRERGRFASLYLIIIYAHVRHISSVNFKYILPFLFCATAVASLLDGQAVAVAGVEVEPGAETGVGAGAEAGSGARAKVKLS